MSDTPTTLVSSRVYSGFWESPGDTLQSSESSFCKERPISTLEPAYGVDNDNDKDEESQSPEPTYVVQKLNNKDDAGYVKNWKLQLHQFLPLTACVAIGAYWLYVTFRIRYILALQFVSHKVFPVAWIFLAVEVGVACEDSDTPIPFRECPLTQLSHSTIAIFPILAIVLDQDSLPSKTPCHWRICSQG